MKTNRIFAFGTLLAALLLMLQLALPAFAQDQDDDNANPQDDPPSRVARLNFSQGSVSFQPGGEGDWVTAVPNRPLTSGDNLWADQNSRAELHVGSTALRMSSETSLTFLALDDHNTQLRVSLGTLLVRVRHLDDGDTFEIDTPNLAFDVQTPGEYRVDVNGDGNQTIVTSWSGRGEVTGGGSSYDVVAGQQSVFNGTDKLDYDIAQLPAKDEFDNWAFDRDHREDNAESANYISTEVTGHEDLDEYGHWRYVAGYGTVWAPNNVDADWAPYRDGHWVWIQPWGWTWVDDEPWGFAPFHYGRWAYAGGGWCWVPGPVIVRPVYAPALVAFVGGGGFHLSVSVGPSVGWFPLAPGEVYVPPYRTSRQYVNVVNVTNTRVNVTQVTNVYNVYNSHTTNVTHITYVNQRVNNSVTVVSHDTFVNARPVQRNVVRVDQREIAEAQVSHRVDVQPVKASVIGPAPAARFRPPAQVINRQVVATHTPAQPRGAFDRREPQMNVRTEQPTAAQPPRPVARPAMPTTQPERQAERPESRPATPAAPARPATPPQPTRPANAQNQTIPRPGQPPHNEHTPPTDLRTNDQRQAQQEQQQQQERQAPRPPNPLVRQAPPSQTRTPEQQRSDEDKFRNWQQQRQQQQRPEAQRQERQPEQRQQQQRSEPRNDHHDDHHEDKPKR